MINDYTAAAAQAVANLQLWRLGALEQLTPAQLIALREELAATLDAIGELEARRRGIH